MALISILLTMKGGIEFRQWINQEFQNDHW